MRIRGGFLTETKVKDPVCGMTVDSSAARGGSFVHQGVEYFFCSPRCHERFRSAPGEFLSPSYKPAGMPAPAPGLRQILAQPTAMKPAALSPVLTQPLQLALNLATPEKPAKAPSAGRPALAVSETSS